MNNAEESRGFGFVKMETGEDANACIEAINGTNLEGKVVTVAHVSQPIQLCWCTAA